MQNPKKALREAYRIIKPGGLICVAVPNSFGIHSKIYGNKWPHLSLPYHLHFFSKQTLSKLVKESGFQIIKISTEELSIYDLLKFILHSLGFSYNFQKPSRVSLVLDKFLAKL